MAPGRSGKRLFTLVVIPHTSESDVAIYRLPLFWIQLACVLVVAGFLTILIMLNNHFQMTAQMHELEELRAVNRQQRAQIQALSDQATALQSQLREISELEEKVRQAFIVLEQESPVRTASLGAILDSGFTTGTAPGREGEGGPGVATAGLAPRVLDGSIDPAQQDAGEAAGAFQELRLQLPVYQDQLERIHKAVVEERVRREATPLIWPVRGLITSSFGIRRSPFGRSYERHDGVDIAAPYGTPVLAAAGGRVTVARYDRGYGRMVKIDHGQGFQTVYGHNSRLAVREGDVVERGDVIAYVGSTGRSTGPHLHYEVIRDGRRVDPRPYLLSVWRR